MTDADEGLRVELTDVLYGVVLANAIYELEFGLTFSNLLLLFALAILVDDWVDYHLHVDRIPKTSRRYALVVVFDIAVLITWYFLTIAHTAGFDWYLVVLVGFFVMQGLWDIAVLRVSPATVPKSPYWQLAGAMALIATGYWLLEPPALLVAVGCILLFATRKAITWRRRLRTTNLPM